MRTNRAPVVRIAAVQGRPGRYVASFRAEVLDATYALEFAGSVVGAVALHRFAEMLKSHYGGPVELELAEGLFPPPNKAVEDMLRSIGPARTPSLHPVG